jgi:hypothetical protein
MPNIYLRHPQHGEKVAFSTLEAQDDIERGWEEFDPSNPDDSESSAPVEEPASGISVNTLKARRRRRG